MLRYLETKKKKIFDTAKYPLNNLSKPSGYYVHHNV
jgi:hypothetical protein